MRFMTMVKAPEGVPPFPELMAAIGRLGQEMAQAGVLVETGGHAPSARGARIRLSGGKLTVTDGPAYAMEVEIREMFDPPGGRPQADGGSCVRTLGRSSSDFPKGISEARSPTNGCNACTVHPYECLDRFVPGK